MFDSKVCTSMKTLENGTQTGQKKKNCQEELGGGRESEEVE